MKVQFQFSTADLAEVTGRTLNRSPLVRRWRLRSAIAGGVVMGLLAYAFVPGDSALRIAVAIVFGIAVCAASLIMLSRPGGNAKTEQFYRHKLGGTGPFTCEVELTPAGVVSRQLGQELFHDWSHVASVAEVAGGIEFVFAPIGSLLVRDRAFADAPQRAEFLARARSHVDPNAPSDTAPTQMAQPAGLPDAPAPTPASALPEREYLVAWLLFFICTSAASAIISAAIGSSAVFLLGIRYGSYLLTGLALIISMGLSYVFFRLFAKRLVSRVQMPGASR